MKCVLIDHEGGGLSVIQDSEIESSLLDQIDQGEIEIIAITASGKIQQAAVRPDEGDRFELIWNEIG